MMKPAQTAAPETAAERDRLRALNAELVEALEEMLPLAVDGWWCPKCRVELGSADVDDEELHINCGAFVGAIPERAVALARAAAALAKAKDPA